MEKRKVLHERTKPHPKRRNIPLQNDGTRKPRHSRKRRHRPPEKILHNHRLRQQSS